MFHIQLLPLHVFSNVISLTILWRFITFRYTIVSSTFAKIFGLKPSCDVIIACNFHNLSVHPFYYFVLLRTMGCQFFMLDSMKFYELFKFLGSKFTTIIILQDFQLPSYLTFNKHLKFLEFGETFSFLT